MGSRNFTPEELEQCAELLEALVSDRLALSAAPHAVRLRLLVAAGRLSRPTRDESDRHAKAFRRRRRDDRLATDRATTASTEIRSARRAEVFRAPPELVDTSDSAAPPRMLLQPRGCYVCKASFRQLHHFYDALCASCAELNYKKRFQTTSLEGRTALITGARVKIGFHAALKMLRAGARVLVTTRFPHNAAERFARESDFEDWRERLQVFGLDLRHLPSVELFARYLTQTESRLDILINNAAQTVRRPAGFYSHLLAGEERAFDSLSPAVQSVLGSYEACKRTLEAPALEHAVVDHVSGLTRWREGGPGAGIRSSAQLSQQPCAYDDAMDEARVFPHGRADADLQQVDLRTMNSWRLKLADVPSPEMLEVQLVNAVAPFILCSKLKPLILKHPTGEKHIVNVSAMEGQFARKKKTDKHPHTNMAKAALNMMTLTSAPDYAESGIFMNAVDTGWVTDEDPAELSARKQQVHDFQPPLDIVDGAARICDPFFSGLITGHHVWGKFFKDYAPAEW